LKMRGGGISALFTGKPIYFELTSMQAVSWHATSLKPQNYPIHRGLRPEDPGDIPVSPSRKEVVKVLVTLAAPFREPPGSGKPKDAYVKTIGKLAPTSWKLVIPDQSTEDNLASLARDVEAVLGTSVTRKVIESAARLKIIQATGAGVDKIDLKAAAEKGIIVCNVRSYSHAVAEHVFALILALAKHVVQHDTEIRKGVWNPNPSLILKDKTIGIVGLGSIGSEVAKRARAFEMRIIANKRRPSSEIRASLGLTFLGSEEDLSYILGESDIIVLSVPLTDKTRGLIGKNELNLMKKEALLINVSRGDLVEEKALVWALQAGKISGAGLDVFGREPLATDSTLIALPNVVLTPHVAGGRPNPDSDEWFTRLGFCIRNIEKAMSGQMPENIVQIP